MMNIYEVLGDFPIETLGTNICQSILLLKQKTDGVSAQKAPILPRAAHPQLCDKRVARMPGDGVTEVFGETPWAFGDETRPTTS